MVGTIYRLSPDRAAALTTAALTKARPFLEASDTPLVLVPTWRCNFRCRYCYFGTGPQPATMLDRATALRRRDAAPRRGRAAPGSPPG